MAGRIRAHLDRHGFTDVMLEVQDAMRPSRTPASTPVLPRVIDAVRAATGQEPIVLPALGGSIPQYAFDALRLPCMWAAYANTDEQNHAPNENLDLECFRQSIAISATLFHSLARGGLS